MNFSEKPKIGVIILAAGSSSRMNGTPKQLLKFQGKTLLRRAAETALQGGFYKTIVVLGANHKIFRKEIEDLPLQIAVNENWQGGVSSSIKAGLLTLSEENLDAVIFMLCDQPFVSAEILRRLRDVFAETKKAIVASEYENTIGVPALFAREIFDELHNLQNDEGAKKIIKKDMNRTALVTVPEAAFDIDTLRDYEELKRLN
ncbi:MAG TPA: nucleotidyltransferase family protein [Pyrinomonadaceae bacterium]|nr:nucleotidyltransferase family protein [Pyrinomonadaceae bacterium]